MGTIIGAKTCTWQQQRGATKTTTTRLNLRTAQRLLLSPHFVFGTRTKLPFSHVVEKFIVSRIDCDARRGQNNVEHFTAGEALTAIAATVVTGPKRVLGVIIRLR